ncbi:hypothetical protein Bca4012_081971 [Brassica carinata]
MFHLACFPRLLMIFFPLIYAWFLQSNIFLLKGGIFLGGFRRCCYPDQPLVGASDSFSSCACVQVPGSYMLDHVYFIEVMYMGTVVAYVKLFKRKPEKLYKWEAMDDDDVEGGSESFPMVPVQIPMNNEKEVTT